MRRLLSTERGFFNFGIKSKVTKWLNPDAHEADLGEKMEAYYDNERKVWVFPGENPEEVAKPIGPPPTPQTVQVATPTPPAHTMSNDPLAAMMAPPPRAPAGLAGKARNAPATPGHRIPGMIVPGSAPAAAPPTFAVFQPTAAAK